MRGAELRRRLTTSPIVWGVIDLAGLLQLVVAGLASAIGASAASLGDRQGFFMPSATISKPPRQCRRLVRRQSLPPPNDRLGERASGRFSQA
jgi:hypothetical protein